MLRVNNLIGFGAGGRLHTVAFVTSAVSSAATIAWPATEDKDLAVLFDLAFDSLSADPAEVTPTGFSGPLVNETAGTGARFMVHYRICDGSETGNITGMNDNNMSKILIIFRGNSPIATATPNTWGSEATANDPAQQSVLAAAADVPVLVFGAAGEFTIAPAFTTESPAFDAEITSNVLRVGYKVYNAAPANHSIDIGDNGGRNHLASGYIALS